MKALVSHDESYVLKDQHYQSCSRKLDLAEQLHSAILTPEHREKHERTLCSMNVDKRHLKKTVEFDSCKRIVRAYRVMADGNHGIVGFREGELYGV